MRAWAMLLGGLAVWAAHFFTLYIAASIFPGTDIARWLTLAATVPALAADGLILWLALRPRQGALDRWLRQTGAIGAALSAIAVIWQALPALLA